MRREERVRQAAQQTDSWRLRWRGRVLLIAGVLLPLLVHGWLLWALPKFAEMYARLEIPLPDLTEFVFQHRLWVVAPLLIAGVPLAGWFESRLSAAAMRLMQGLAVFNSVLALAILGAVMVALYWPLHRVGV